MPSSYQTPLDIANRGLQLVGAPTITSFSDASRNAYEVNLCYDKLRQAELSRNVWRFAVRRATLSPLSGSTLLLAPQLFSTTQTYPKGAIVQDGNGQWWQSLVAGNVGRTPGVFAIGQPATWGPYAGPVTADPYTVSSNGTGYTLGQSVYMALSNGVVNVYSSLQDNNTANPLLPTTWDATTAYTVNDVVEYNGYYYISLLPVNVNNTPGNSDPQWQSTITYAQGAMVAGYDGNQYESLVANNAGNNPVADTAQAFWGITGNKEPWTATFAGSVPSLAWVSNTGMGVSTQPISYPTGAGPVEDMATKNVFLLPANFLRIAPQHPKQGLLKWLGGPAWDPPNDWVFENDYFLSASPTPLVFRFVVDVQDVSTMDAMFCEGLAHRIALALCEVLTQSPVKYKQLFEAYTAFMTEARIVNAIEEGSVRTPQDEYVTVRQ